MKKTITITVTDKQDLTQLYVDNSSISVIQDKNAIQIIANNEGFIELAKHCLYLSLDKHYNGYHFHLDSSNSLNDKSLDLILELSKLEEKKVPSN